MLVRDGPVSRHGRPQAGKIDSLDGPEEHVTPPVDKCQGLGLGRQGSGGDQVKCLAAVRRQTSEIDPGQPGIFLSLHSKNLSIGAGYSIRYEAGPQRDV